MSTVEGQRTFSRIESYEPLTEVQLRMIGQTLGPIQSMVVKLGSADISKGAGIIDRNTKCLWTTDRRRIEISFKYGVLTASCSKTADPGCPVANS